MPRARARAHGRTTPGCCAAPRSGGWLFLRTASLRAALLLATWAATSLGSDELAAFQVAMTIYFTIAFALDALAIAAQALVGLGLGAGDVGRVRAVLRRCLQWGVGGGVVVGALVIATAWVLPALFTSSPEVAGAAAAGARGARPLGAARRTRVRARRRAHRRRRRALPRVDGAREPRRVRAARARRSSRSRRAGAAGPAWLMAAFAIGYLAARAVTLSLRARGSAWMVVGAPV